MRLAASVLFLLTVLAATAQSRFAFENTYHPIDTARSEGDLLLHADNVGFLKNDEYFGDYAEGYTLIGYQLNPTLHYYLTDSITLEAGAQCVYYGGEEHFADVYPLVRATWQATKRWRLTVGTLRGHTYHDLHEAMWDPERQLTDKPEVGVQIEYEGTRLSGETWLNWQQFIRHGDTIPEKFTYGFALDWKINESLSLPFRTIISHIGGQISNFEERMQTLMNSSLLLRYSKRVALRTEVYVNAEAHYFHTMVGSVVRPFADGYAVHPRVGVLSRWLEADLGFWHSSDYYALYGNPIFASISNYKSDVYNAERNILTANLNFNFMKRDLLRLSFGGSLYQDLDAGQTEYTYNIMMVLTPLAKLYSR